jgi:hypothetical protein
MAGTEIYVQLVVAFPRDPKVRALARYGADAGLARDLYVHMLLHCKENLTDGFVPTEEVWALAFPLPPDHANQLAKQLASVGLIKELSNPEAPGWQVCAFLKRNRSREQVEALSQVRAEAGREGGRKSRRPPGQARSRANRKQVGNQRASNLPPRVQSTENIDASNEASSSAPTVPADAHVGTVVGAFVDGATQAGLHVPPASIKARVGKAARELVERDHYPIALVIDSARRLGASGYDDLAKQVRMDDASSNGTSRGRHSAGSTGAERAQAAVQAGEEVQGLIDRGELSL